MLMVTDIARAHRAVALTSPVHAYPGASDPAHRMSTLAASLDTATWQDLDRRHYLHPFTDSRALHARGARIITRAQGVYLWDSEGVRILDGMAGLWCVNVGYTARTGRGGRRADA